MVVPFLLAGLISGQTYQAIGMVEGVWLEQRPFPGSAFVELKAVLSTAKTPRALCEAAFGTGAFDPSEPDLKSRTVLSETEHERVTYEQITPPLVSARDYVVRTKRIPLPDGSCRMTFEAAADVEKPSPPGWLRVKMLSGYWLFQPIDGGHTRLTYVVHSDPGGAIPPFLAEGSRRTLAARWAKRVVAKAKD
jgi:hypothetical protein